MEDLDTIKGIIGGYSEIKDINPEDLYIDMQLGFDQEENEYFIEYGLKDTSVVGTDGLVPKLRYDTLEEAWDEYRDQYPEMYQSFPEATKLLTHPKEYRSPLLGGNPAEKIVDAKNNI